MVATKQATVKTLPKSIIRSKQLIEY